MSWQELSETPHGDLRDAKAEIERLTAVNYDLLEALEAIGGGRKTTEDLLGGDCEVILDRYIDTAREAIAKAKGGDA